MGLAKAKPNAGDWRVRQRHIIAFARSHVPRSLSIPDKQWPTAIGRAVYWLLPWNVEGYPGVKRGVGELLGKRASWEAFKAWRAGRRTCPQWFRTMLADMIEGRCRAGLQIVQELRNWKPPEKRIVGALAVDPLTGRDNRGSRIGRKAARSTDQKTTPLTDAAGRDQKPSGDFD